MRGEGKEAEGEGRQRVGLGWVRVGRERGGGGQSERQARAQGVWPDCFTCTFFDAAKTMVVLGALRSDRPRITSTFRMNRA